MTDLTGKKNLSFALMLLAVILASAALFLLCYQFDNKYTRPRPQAGGGQIHLNMGWYDDDPLFYLVDGWSFYQGKLLTPEEIADHSPDASFYIGRYGGFDLGDPHADPHGQGTYHIQILTDGTTRQYALELTEIYSRCRLWINGRLLYSSGFGDDHAAGRGFLTFEATDSVDIVVQASDDSGFYSGMVYPPAFGSPDQVGRTVFLRQLIHGSACTLALALAVFCALAALLFRFRRPYGTLSLLFLCFCVSTAWPLLQIMDLSSAVWPAVERCCYYGIFLLLIGIQGQICMLPRRFFLPACAAGALICLSVLLLPLFPVTHAGALMAFSRVLAAYKWFTAVWLLGTALWATARERPYSRALLTGNCVFASALIMDKLLPAFEPVYLGWFVELAGGILLLLIGGIAFYDTVQIYRTDAELRAEGRLAQLQLQVRSEHARLQQEYVQRTRRQLHESRNRLTLISHYLEAGKLDELRGYLHELTDSMGKDPEDGPCQYTENNLVDAILSVQLTRAARDNIYVEQELDALPSTLPYSDSDLTSLLMNLLNNALEASLRLRSLQPDLPCWIDLAIRLSGDSLVISCVNAAPCDSDPARTSKEDRQAHGFGLSLLREIAEKYGGDVKIQRREDSFSVVITLEYGDTPVPSPSAGPKLR